MQLCGGFVLVVFADANCYGAGFRTDIETNAASGAACAGIGDCIIALAV
jgi:hypothetical protein